MGTSRCVAPRQTASTSWSERQRHHAELEWRLQDVVDLIGERTGWNAARAVALMHRPWIVRIGRGRYRFQDQPPFTGRWADYARDPRYPRASRTRQPWLPLSFG